MTTCNREIVRRLSRILDADREALVDEKCEHDETTRRAVIRNVLGDAWYLWLATRFEWK